MITFVLPKSAVAVLAALLAIAAQPGLVQGQNYDCGYNCAPCGDNQCEGNTYGATAPWNMDCWGPTETGGCMHCRAPSLTANAVDAMIIGRVVEAATVRELRAVVAAYGNRLLLNASRNVVVIKGNGCDPDALSTVVYLTPSKARALARLNTRALESFLASLERRQVTRPNA